MRPMIVTLCLLSVLGTTPGATAHEEKPGQEAASPAPGLKLETLMKQVLEGVVGTEVIVSRVTIPPHTTLPKHWHPGEEFAYMVEGSITLWQKDKDDITLRAGGAAMVPLRQVHTAITADEGATLIVFRVHEQDQPERILVE